MPRVADATLHDRILDAAYKLLRRKGADAITLRAVAEEAGTTTPTVYKRFATKEDLVMAVANRIRHRLNRELMAQPSLNGAVRIYFKLAFEHPHDYKLMFEHGWPRLFEDEDDSPGQVWAAQELVRMHGGAMEDYRAMVSCIWMMLHGAASLLTAAPVNPFTQSIRDACVQACDTMIEHPELFPTKA